MTYHLYQTDCMESLDGNGEQQDFQNNNKTWPSVHHVHKVAVCIPRY
jgi:hypothetical protein